MRLTEKDNSGQYFSIAESKTFDEEQQCVNKLGQLEDIEEENKIDILQAVDICKKANEQKVIYQKEDYGISSFAILDDLDVEILNHRLYVNARGMYVSLDLLEYGKTWALDKKELAKENCYESNYYL